MSRLRSLTGPSPVLFLCLLASQAGLLVLSPILPEIAREFGVSTATAGQLRSLSGLIGGLTALGLALSPWRPGLRDILAGGAALVTLGSVLSAAAPSFAVLAGAQAVLGIGIGALVAAGIAAAGVWPQPGERAHVLAWAIAGMPVAWIAGMPVIGIVVQAGWRATFLAIPAVAGLVALTLVRLRAADAPTRRGERPRVARFAVGELLANAAWAGVLVYIGALLVERYDVSPSLAAVGLAFTAAAMLPGTFGARRLTPTPRRLAMVTAIQAVLVLALTAMHAGAIATLAVLSVMAFFNGVRSMLASSLGMDSAPEDKLAVMSMRAAANQFGYLLGAGLGGAALALGGFGALGIVYAGLFLAANVVHGARVPVLMPGTPAGATR
jgi:MFS transporter, DHA1 family, inner membrane transport protein